MSAGFDARILAAWRCECHSLVRCAGRLVWYSNAMVPRPLFRLLSRFILHPFFRLTRGQTLGVRGVVRDDQGRFLLVRHSYAPGWLFPGGGVDRGEALEDALVRELREEVGVLAQSRPRLISIHANFAHFKGDHVALFEVERWEQVAVSSLEIAESGFLFRG